MKTTISMFGVVVFLVLLLHGCLAKKTNVNNVIFEKNYICDSIISPTYNFIFEDDSAIYSPIKKEPFDFKLQITRDYVRINKEKYYYILGGLNIDTLGLVNITDDAYLYKKSKDYDKSAVLYSFNKKLEETWVIREEGYFSDYEVALKGVKYDETIKDTIFSFSYNFLGKKFPNGYYYEIFIVSKQYGILSFSFNNGIQCNCVVEE